jgi:hypothetical protein
MNLIMHELNQVRLPVRPREFVSPCLSPGMPRNRSLHRDFPPWKGLPRAWKKDLK